MTLVFHSFAQYLSRKMEPPLQVHMKNMYSCVALSTLAAGVGGCVQLLTGLSLGGFLNFLIGMGFVIALMNTPDDDRNAETRLSYLLSFSFVSGVGLGPLLDVVISVQPAVIPIAFFGSCLIFTCFTLASICCTQRQYIYLGGTRMFFRFVLMLMSLLTHFMGSYLEFKIQIYIGIAVTCALILFDTQIIMEKRRNTVPDEDYTRHSIYLFLDLMEIFRYLLVIHTDMESI